MKTLMFSIVAAFASVGAFADATIDRVLVRQQWPWDEKVAIDFVLTNVTSATEIDCAVYRGATPVSVSYGAFTGDLCELTEDGTYRIMFDPSHIPDRPSKGETLRFVLTPSAMTDESSYREVLYKIIDLESPYSITNVTRGNILSGAYGSFETDYGKIGEGYNTSLSDVLIWTGVTNYPGAKTSKLVMRKIPAGSFTYPRRMVWGDTAQTCEVTNDFYIGVFELTQGQFDKIQNIASSSYGNRSAYYDPLFAGAELPVNRCSNYSLFDGNSRSAKQSTGTIGNLNAAIGNGHYVTLPSKGQWLYAMKAGTDTYYYDGLAGGAPENTAKDSRFDVLGRYAGNGGMVDNGDGTITTNGVVAVGSYRPNAYGLYDMLGNVIEAVFENPTTLDTLEAQTGTIAEAVSGNSHTARGSGWSSDAAAWPFAVTSYKLYGSLSANAQNDGGCGYRLALWVDPGYSGAEE